jgi:hypothetical protein
MEIFKKEFQKKYTSYEEQTLEMPQGVENKPI